MLVSFSSVGCTSQRMFSVSLLGAALFCYIFVTLVDKWGGGPVKVVDPPHFLHTLKSSSSLSSKVSVKKAHKAEDWEKLYSNRVDHVRNVCEHDEMAMLRRVWRVAANRRFGKKAYCKTRMCPIIVDEKKVLFFCFIPKVASTKIKEFFLNISGVPLNETFTSNETALHLAANTFLHRVSPMYYPASTARRFFKILFVRHPFDRLVSVFRDKAEVPRDKEPYFYATYWDRVVTKLRPNSTIDDQTRITFPEFVWYLTHSLERDFDEHWAPYWGRCDPCLVDYDFVGKLETASHDFEYAFNKVGITSPPGYWTNAMPSTQRSTTLKYFSQIPKKQILQLQKIYKLDFELFNYTLDGFL